MSDHYILDENGGPQKADLMEWARWMEQSGQSRVVAKTEIGDAKVSTVFLGLDHQFGDGPPLIYETMVFGRALDGEQDRYTTRQQALDGHEAIVERVKSSSGATTPRTRAR